MWGALARLLRSRYYVGGSLVVTLALLAGVALTSLVTLGYWTPTFMRPQSSLIITGPGVSSNGGIQVFALGAVVHPGVYALAAGAREHDLIDAAGGLLADADLTRIDLAAPLADGQEVYFPLVGEQVPLTLGGKLDINVASPADLHNALGLSLVIADHIVAYRAAHGPFTAVSQLLLVPITRTTYDRIKDLITV
ncbi:MAG TPA: ComEA family DNA-binding protein [Ktedonobacterales bacterium]|nr:ComEA family DNA-binding protein [Ktedonobacterales bacterium]